MKHKLAYRLNETVREHEQESLSVPASKKHLTFRQYVKGIASSSFLVAFMVFVSAVDTLMMILQTSQVSRLELPGFYGSVNEILMALYIFEVMLRFFADPKKYCKMKRNGIEFFLVFMSLLPMYIEPHEAHFLYSMRPLRLLKVIFAVDKLRLFSEALIIALKDLVYVAAAMVMLMYLFGIIGFFEYGNPETGDPSKWGDLSTTLFTLFSFATLDGWTTVESALDELGFQGNRVYSVVYVLNGYFLLFSMAVGMVITVVQKASAKYEKELRKHRKKNWANKQREIQQQEDAREKAKALCVDFRDDLSEKMAEMRKALKTRDYVMTDELYTSRAFLDMYFTTLDRLERVQDRLITQKKTNISVMADILEVKILEEEGETFTGSSRTSQKASGKRKSKQKHCDSTSSQDREP